MVITVKFLNFGSWDVGKLCCNYPKIQTKNPYLRVLGKKKNANGIANSVEPDQTAPLGAV